MAEGDGLGSERGAVPAEISEAHLRVGMDRATPVPLASELRAKDAVINKPH